MGGRGRLWQPARPCPPSTPTPLHHISAFLIPKNFLTLAPLIFESSQNELDLADAQCLAKNGCKYVLEGEWRRKTGIFAAHVLRICSMLVHHTISVLACKLAA